MPSLGRQRPRSSRAAAPSPRRSRRKMHHHAGTEGCSAPHTYGTLAERSPVAASRRLQPAMCHGAAGAASPAAPCAADPPPLLLSGASVLGGGCQDGRWGLPSLPGRREHSSSVPLTLPPRSVLGGPAPAPAPPQGSGRPNFAPSSAHLRARRRSAPGRSEADRHPPGKSDPLPRDRRLACGRAAGGMGRPAAWETRTR